MGQDKTTVRNVIDRLGRRDVMAACNVTTQAVTNWIGKESIPPAHYLTLRRLGRTVGFEVPEEYFRRAVQ